MSGAIGFLVDGSFVSGVGTLGVWRNNALLIGAGAGQTAAWGQNILYQSADNHLRTCNQFGDSLLVDVRGVTFAAGSQTSNYWAAFLADGRTGVYDARTFQWPTAGLLGVVDDVAFLKTDWNAGGISAWRNGSMLWGTANAQPSILTVPQFSALDANRCIWCENGHLAAYGLPAPAQTELIFDPFVLEIGGVLWLGYHSERVILRRWGDASQGYILEPAGGYYTAGRMVDGSHIEVAWARGPGAAGDVETAIQDLTAPMVPLGSAPPIPIPIPPEPGPVPQPPLPVPIPEERVMLYSANLLTGFLRGELVTVSGGVAIRKPDGYFVCVTPEGNIERRPNPPDPLEGYQPGAWETFRKSGNFLVAERDGNREYAFQYVP